MHGFPPNVNQIEERFSVGTGTIFTYAPSVYVPSGRPLTGSLIAHERVHIGQQGDDPAAWWDRYLDDVEFRLEQEVEAHRAEWAFLPAQQSTGGEDLDREAPRLTSVRLYDLASRGVEDARPDIETRNDLMDQVERYADEVDRAWAEAGWTPSSYWPHLPTHVLWLARHQCLELPYEACGDADPSSIRKAIKRLAQLLPLTLRQAPGR